MADSLPPAYLEVHPPKSKQFRHPRRNPLTGLIVVHTAESLLDTVGPDSGAEGVASYLSIRDTPGSYHDLVDSDTIVHVVDYDDEAFHDATGSNRYSLGLSFALAVHNWATMDRAQRDAFIENGAQAAARMARHVHARTGIVVPAKRVTRAESEAGKPGFISHAERDPNRRTDPGNLPHQFPWDQFLARYAQLTVDLGNSTPEDPEEFTMDAEARAEFAAIREEIGELRKGQLVHIDENRKQYGSLRGWIAATAEVVGSFLKPAKSFNSMRKRAGELDTYANPPEKN